MDKDRIMKEHPSVCWDCAFSRGVSEKLLEEGICGCCMFGKECEEAITEESTEYLKPMLMKIKVKEMYSGWIYSKASPFDDTKETGYGMMVNCQLQTKECTECPYKTMYGYNIRKDYYSSKEIMEIICKSQRK